jgi:dihydropteroate synthase
LEEFKAKSRIYFSGNFKQKFLGDLMSSPLTFKVKDQIYDCAARTYVMGIVNLTPDSFSQDGLYHRSNYIDRAIRQAWQMVADGADFIDVGAESSRPGSTPLPEEEEARRLFSVLQELVTAVSVPISVDTYKPRIAARALESGAAIINDIWGLSAPDDAGRQMAQVVAAAGATVVIMHNRAQSGYQDLVREVIAALEHSVGIALNAGIDCQRIIVDPGIGGSFGKTQHENLLLLQQLQRLKVLGRPILLGTSRKSVIGTALNLPVSERLEGTIATNVWGVSQGANLVRAHDVKAVSRAVRMCDAIIHE